VKCQRGLVVSVLGSSGALKYGLHPTRIGVNVTFLSNSQDGQLQLAQTKMTQRSELVNYAPVLQAPRLNKYLRRFKANVRVYCVRTVFGEKTNFCSAINSNQ